MSIGMSITVTPVLVADLGVAGERMPVYAHVVDHPDACGLRRSSQRFV